VVILVSLTDWDKLLLLMRLNNNAAIKVPFRGFRGRLLGEITKGITYNQTKS
jgi:hypothetical protein